MKQQSEIELLAAIICDDPPPTRAERKAFLAMLRAQGITPIGEQA